MYADRYGSTGIKPGALGVAIGLNGAIIAALIFSTPEFIKIPDKAFIAKNIPLLPDPPPVEEPKLETKIKPKVDPKVFDPPPIERPTATDPVAPTKSDTFTAAGPTGTEGGGVGGTGTILPPYIAPPVPVLVGARPDPAFARSFQPSYPPGERRAEREGRVVIRVLIGVDGRVKQVELVSAASDQFFEATRKQALDKWRFKPATRDGIPEEAWRTMGVSFVLNGED